MEPSQKIHFCKIHPDEFLIAHFSWVEKKKPKEQDMCIVCGNEWWAKNGSKELGLRISEFTTKEKRHE